ncbi:MAG: hypothetical protein MK106_08490 [Mariniblastus sp.]|nr:hypothetical protein [Mariniblastus sp.]
MKSFRKKPFFVVALILAVTMMTTVGCGEPYPLRGTVTLDGEPIQRGTIVFRPNADSGNAGPSATTRIIQGEFIVPAGQKFSAGPTLATITDESQPGRDLNASFDFPSEPTTEFLIEAQDANENSR